jgi:hypothetical protein
MVVEAWVAVEGPAVVVGPVAFEVAALEIAAMFAATRSRILAFSFALVWLLLDMVVTCVDPRVQVKGMVLEREEETEVYMWLKNRRETGRNARCWSMISTEPVKREKAVSRERHECEILFDELDDVDKAYEMSKTPFTTMSCFRKFLLLPKATADTLSEEIGDRTSWLEVNEPDVVCWKLSHCSCKTTQGYGHCESIHTQHSMST